MKKLFALAVSLLFAVMLFASSANAAYYGGGFRAYSSPRVYVGPRVYVAPRPVYVAPRPVVVVRPRPVYIAPHPVIVAPVIPTVAPGVDVNAYGQPAPVVAGPVQHGFVDYVYAVLLLLVILALFSCSFYAFVYMDPFDWWVDGMVYVGAYDGEYLQ